MERFLVWKGKNKKGCSGSLVPDIKKLVQKESKVSENIKNYYSKTDPSIVERRIQSILRDKEVESILAISSFYS